MIFLIFVIKILTNKKDIPMRTLKVSEIFTTSELRDKITSINKYNDVIDWTIIRCVLNNPGIFANEIAQVLCVSVQKVYKVIEDFNTKGKDFKTDKSWGGRRKETSYLSLEEEQDILDKLKEKAKKGLIITAKDIKQEFEIKIGESVSEEYIWKVFKRHNWTKKTPRPEHPKTDYEKQEDFKKNSMKTWQPPL